jgi:hypothetical protein
MAQAGSANSSSAPKFPPVTGTLEQGLAKGERIGCDVASEKLIRSHVCDLRFYGSDVSGALMAVSGPRLPSQRALK